jgi:signal transduction histidine kinase
MGVSMGYEKLSPERDGISSENLLELGGVRTDPGGAALGVGVNGIPRMRMPSVARLTRPLLAAHRRWISLSLMAALALTTLVALELAHPTAYIAPTLRATADTVLTLFAFAGAWLMEGQFAYSRRLRDLMLFGLFMTLGLALMAFYVVPVTIGLKSNIFPAAALWQQLFLATILAAIALTPSGTMTVGRRAEGLAAAAAVASVALAGVLGVVFVAALEPSHPVSGLAATAHHPFELVLVIAAVAMYVRAGIAFAARERAVRDGSSAFLCGGALLLGAAQLQHLALPLISPDSISAREPIRIVAIALLLIAALRHELQARTILARSAASAERTRVARDLHDGLAQDLALIAAHSDRIAAEFGPDHPVVIAAKRALQLSRETISQLSDSSGSSPREALEAVAHELGNRFGIAVAVDAQLDGELAPEAREHVLRIAREAIANAARHGGAKHVIVSLKRVDGVVSLRVRDDGRGIAGPDREATPEGFGLRSIHERAASLGGYMTVRTPGRSGTELEVVLP